ncbi:efflux RND transporter permease subunit [Neobacillus drentensis]|uniref:efflux RND transporter permease subunit n=1 Tax=Neobacillus drentensis TaxID=220684 RepID=UPI001F20CF9C|nr:efflux RND transporter permease subunit [Neobacillus drentensis]ULT55103.1 efflux RND transporter permease subunit [Neobacillus drentensis]
MTWFTKWSFRNKAAVSLTTVLILIMGIVSYFTLPMEFLPTADNPQVTVVVLGQGTDVATMTDTVTAPLEHSVAAVKGKSETYSTTGDGFSKIDLMFEAGTDMKQAAADVQKAIDTVKLPEGTNKPIVVQLNTDMIPIADISVTFKDGITKENSKLADEKIFPALKQMKGVGSVAMYGRGVNEVSIELDQAKLSQYKLPAQVVAAALQGQNLAAAVGQKTIDGKTSNIKVVGTLESLEDLKNVPVIQGVKLGDIAHVQKASQEDHITRVNGEDALLAVITKDSNSSAVSIIKEVRKEAKALTKKYENANVRVFYSTADMVVNSVTSMIKEVLLGALFATIVIMFFLRNIRSTFITIVSIPLSLCLTLFLLGRSGITLNILTIGGVAVAVGRLVDDSIVVIENIFRKMQDEKFSIELVIAATKEVASAITSSTLTTVAVFLPLGLVGAGLKDFLLPFALTVTYSLLSSLLVALTVVPLMSAGLLKKANLPKHRPSKRYVSMLRWSLNHKWVILLSSALLFFGSIGAYFVMPKGAVDSSDAELVTVSLDYPNETPIKIVHDNTLKLENYLLDQDGPKAIYTQLGNSPDAAQYGEVGSPTSAAFTIVMKKNANTERFINQVKKQKENYPGAELLSGTGSLTGGSSTSITIDVVGGKMADIEASAMKIKNVIKDIKGVEKVETNQEEKKPVYTFSVDPEVARPSEVIQQLGMMLNRMPIGSVNLDGNHTPVYLEPILNPSDKKDLEGIMVTNQQKLVPITSVAKLDVENKATQILHKGGETYLRVTATVDPKQLSVVSGKINTKINGTKSGTGLKFPDDVKVYVGGAAVNQANDFTDLFLTMALSIGIVYLIMVITFKTLRAPLAILFSLPLAAIGAIIGLLVSRIPVDITALLGALMLIGIVVTNAIVLIDRVKQNEVKMIMREAILDAASTRIRPILMTAIATICAMLPLLFKKAEMGSLVSQSLAIVVIGGLAISTLLTLVVVPVIYELFHFKKSKKQRIAQNQNQLGEEPFSG